MFKFLCNRFCYLIIPNTKIDYNFKIHPFGKSYICKQNYFKNVIVFQEAVSK